MKKTAKYIILTAVAGAVLASCQREQLPATATGDGPRVISVSFADATKTALDGIQAKFCAGDIILVSNGTELEDCKVGLDDSGNAQITTTLKGALKAVYPSEAAVRNGYAIDLTQIRVPIAQRGRFKDAHICTSTITADGLSATFINRSAILKFYVDKSIGVTSIKVTGTGADIATGSKTITVTAPSGKTLANVTDDPQKRICYVAVLPGVNANQLTFKTEATTQPTLLRTPTTDITLEAGTLYKAFMPYYIDLGDAGKWGYCNVGAFLPEEAGRYFAWGDTEGQTWTGSAWSGGGFSTPPDVGSPVPAELPLQYDAAYQNWGGSWRIPTTGGYVEFFKECYAEWGTYNSVDGLIVYKAKEGDAGYAYLDSKMIQYSGSGNTWNSTTKSRPSYSTNFDTFVFFPVAGYGRKSSFNNEGSLSLCWSSTLTSNLAYHTGLSSGHVDVQYRGDRFCGLSIRPILNDEWHYKDIDDGGTI